MALSIFCASSHECTKLDLLVRPAFICLQLGLASTGDHSLFETWLSECLGCPSLEELT